jgi:hypothetical protein
MIGGMSHTIVPQGLLAPNALVFSVVPAGYAPPPPGPLFLGVEAIASVDLSTVTEVSLNLRKPDGSLISLEANYQPAPQQLISNATNTTPIVVTVPDASVLDELVTIADVVGNTNANGGPYFFALLSPTTIALYADAALTQPIAGNAAYVSGGTLTPSDSGTASYELSVATSSRPLGDLDQIGNWEVVVQLGLVDGGVLPCKREVLDVISPFATD